MEPMRPEQIGKILSTRPNVKIEDIREYQRLLGERFYAASPFAPRAMPAGEKAAREERFQELHQMLFG